MKTLTKVAIGLGVVGAAGAGLAWAARKVVDLALDDPSRDDDSELSPVEEVALAVTETVDQAATFIKAGVEQVAANIAGTLSRTPE